MSNENVFSSFEELLSKEQEIKEKIRDVVHKLDQSARKIAMMFQSIHRSEKDDEKLNENVRDIFQEVKTHYRELSECIPQGEYFKYLHIWQGVSNKLCFLASLLVYIESKKLAAREEVMEMLGVCTQRQNGFHIELEDYLYGLLCLANELSRLAVNSVTMSDYKRPIEISTFLNELESGFRLLNLKNDFLRKKYDGLKYDIKKVEQVVYDIRIRNLVPEEAK